VTTAYSADEAARCQPSALPLVTRWFILGAGAEAHRAAGRKRPGRTRPHGSPVSESEEKPPGKSGSEQQRSRFTASSAQKAAGPGAPPAFEDYPLTRQEYIQAMVHLYRAEVHRSNVWRQRLDHTTNWAVVSVAAMVTFAFSEPLHEHVLLLLSNLVVLGFLFIEARRFRYFSVYRARVRMMEENFWIPIITRQLESPRTDWREWVAMDLDVPKFKDTVLEAFAFRLNYIYVYVFGGILFTWILKVWIHPEQATTWGELYEHIGIATVPGWIVLVLGVIFYGALGVVLYWGGRVHISEDEIHGFEQQLEHWKM
jgi:uncharacterized membrane protein